MPLPTQHAFVGRERELAALRRELARDRPSLVVVLGRRRVGKSRLLQEAAGGRPTIYYQATRVVSSMSLDLFKAEAAKTIGPDAVLAGIGDWHAVLWHVAGAAERLPGLTVILDEFPYLCDADPALPSVVQKFWDGWSTAGSPFNLVLCGSKISFMDSLLGERNPLHGRQTFRLDLGPLSYREAAAFFPDASAEDCLYAYGIFGGMPFYLGLCDPRAPLRDNVVDLVLAPGAPLADEPDLLLQAELRDVTRYATILRSIAGGCTRTRDIVGRVRELPNASALAPYLAKLAELRLIRTVRSLDAAEHERDRRYHIDDPFLAFWYRFCLPSLSALQASEAEEVWRHAVEPALDEHMGALFEWICGEHARLYLKELLPAPAREVGQIWAVDYDIDVAGRLLDGRAFFGECKWWRSPVGENVLDRLVDRSSRTTFGREAPGRHHLVYARQGFTEDLRNRAKADPAVHLLTPATLLARPAQADTPAARRRRGSRA
jgi:AAA+ ATPase superfamily predicted ATPase